MRTLTLTLTSDDGKLVAQSQRSWPSPETHKGLFILGIMVEELEHRLDILERDGPWKPQHIDAPPFPEEDYKRHVEQSKKTPPPKEL